MLPVSILPITTLPVTSPSLLSIAETKYCLGSKASPLITSTAFVDKLTCGPLISFTVKFKVVKTSFLASSCVLTVIVCTSFSFLVSTSPVTVLVTAL